MKKLLAILAALALTGCGQPEPISDYSAPYLGKGVLPTAAPVDVFERCSEPSGNLVKKGHKEALCADEPRTQTRTFTDTAPPVSDGPEGKPNGDNSDANGKGGNKHDRDDFTHGGTETAEDKKGV